MGSLSGPKSCKQATLLDGVTAQSDGSWVDVGSLRRMTIHIKGITSATCQIRGSCAPTKPDDTADEVQIGNDITSDTIYEITAKLRWVKVKVSAYTSGTIYAYLVGDEFLYSS